MKQSELHGFVSSKRDLDKRLAIYINRRALDIEHWSMFCDPSCPITFRWIDVHRNIWFMEAIRIFELRKSEEALASFMMAARKENANRVSLRMERKMSVDSNVLNTAKSTHDN